jgi:N-acetyl-anhydromuramyl-L-alanine amidase AmpD
MAVIDNKVSKSNSLSTIIKKSNRSKSILRKTNSDIDKNGDCIGYVVDFPASKWSKPKYTKSNQSIKNCNKNIVKGQTEEKSEGEVSKIVKTNCDCSKASIKNGFIKNMNIIKDRAKNLEHGTLNAVKAIVFHRTVTSKYSKPTKSAGAHFFIAKNGKIYQTASLGYKTYHVGPIYSKCYQLKTCSKSYTKKIRHIRTTKRKQLVKEGIILNNKKYSNGMYKDRHEHAEARAEHAAKKKFPERYPINSDSIGLEVVGMYDSKTKKWEKITEKQKESITCLTKALMRLYKVPREHIYTHEQIKRKTKGEGGSYKDRILENIT